MSEEKMTEREILEQIVVHKGCLANQADILCGECPLRPCRSCFDAYDLAKTRLAELDAEEAGIVPELKGVKMVVTDDNDYEEDRFVFGRLPNGYLITAEDENAAKSTSCRSWTEAKPLPETAEDFSDKTLGEVMELGYVVTIEKTDS